MNDDVPACGHTKIKEITWHEDLGQSGKFMCLNCNTDFVPLTNDIRKYLSSRRNEVKNSLFTKQP